MAVVHPGAELGGAGGHARSPSPSRRMDAHRNCFCVVAVPRPEALPDLLFCNASKVNADRHNGGIYHLTDVYGNFYAGDMLVADVNGDSAPDILTVTTG